MPRQPRIRLTPMQRDVLWLCEEAGSETLASVANQIRHHVTWSSGHDERFEIAEAIEGLRRFGLVELCFFDPPPDPSHVLERDCSSLRRITVLELLLPTEDGNWTTLRPDVVPSDTRVELCMTEKGFAALTN